MVFFFSKKYRYLKSKISSFTICFFYCFSIFYTYPNLSKNYEIFCSVLLYEL